MFILIQQWLTYHSNFNFNHLSLLNRYRNSRYQKLQYQPQPFLTITSRRAQKPAMNGVSSMLICVGLIINYMAYDQRH